MRCVCVCVCERERENKREPTLYLLCVCERYAYVWQSAHAWLNLCVTVCLTARKRKGNPQPIVWRENKSLRSRKRDSMQISDNSGPCLSVHPLIHRILM